MECGEEACHLCEDDNDRNSLPFHAQEHPLLQSARANGSDLPRTPRGPMPPWAAASSSRAPRDRTATGATPPHSPTPPRMTPPGLPEEEAGGSSQSNLSLLNAFDTKFSKELFVAARVGDACQLSELLHRLNSTAMAQVCKAQGPAPQDPTSTSERCEKAGELVAAYLYRIREPNASNPAAAVHDTLLGVACGDGRIEAVRLLLESRADPHPASEDVSSPLHCAAQSGSLLCVLMVLDRLQASSRSVSVSELRNADGESPETLACSVGASDVVRALEIFGEMQQDAESRQLGSSHVSGAVEGGLRGGMGTGDLLSFVDLAAEVQSTAGRSASSLLRRSVAGSRLVRNLFKRIPEDEMELHKLVELTCEGIKTAEAMLLSTPWEPTDPALDPAVRGFVATAELRSHWQKLRTAAMREEAGEHAASLEDFWQTHLTADAMVSTIRGAMGDTFQLLLTVLWLYTREAWLRHILDSLAATLHAVSSHWPGAGGYNGSADGATGATPHWPADLPSALRIVAPLLDALAPCVELVQSSLCWFEEAGIRHAAVTYRPLSLPMLGLQRLVDKYILLKKNPNEEKKPGHSAKDEDDEALGGGAWLSLGSGSFFSSMSSRAEAVRRLTKTRCNALLFIRPDEGAPCYPKHMMLRGSNVDDTLFPLDALFRITRITRTVSSELDPENNVRGGAASRWPVMIIEVSASAHFLEVTELLERRGDFAPGEADRRIEEWAASAPPGEEYERLVLAGEMLVKMCGAQKTNGLDFRPKLSFSGSGKAGAASAAQAARAEKATDLLGRAAAIAEDSSEAEGVARALLAQARARVGVPGSEAAREAGGRKSVRMLEEALGVSHPQTCSARLAWSELGVLT